MARLDISVDLGNEAMRTANDVLSAVTAALTRQVGPDDLLVDGQGGALRDENGNSVGTWEVRSGPTGPLMGRDI